MVRRSQAGGGHRNLPPLSEEDLSVYRVLEKHEQVPHRGRARSAAPHPLPKCFTANGPNQLWSWDISYSASQTRGQHWHLYLIVDIFSRKIVGWEVHEREGADLASALIRQAVLSEGCITRPLVLHADNGSPMKGATMKTTMEKLGITASYSRPRVSNDNPFSEALFRTCKYRPDWPTKGFAAKAEAQAWVNPSQAGITASTCTAPSASSRQMRATPAMIVQRSPTAPYSMQMPARKTRNAGQVKPETGNPPDQYG